MDTVPDGLSLQLLQDRVLAFSQTTTEMVARSREAVERSRTLLDKTKHLLKASAWTRPPDAN